MNLNRGRFFWKRISKSPKGPNAEGLGPESPSAEGKGESGVHGVGAPSTLTFYIFSFFIKISILGIFRLKIKL